MRIVPIVLIFLIKRVEKIEDNYSRQKLSAQDRKMNSFQNLKKSPAQFQPGGWYIAKTIHFQRNTIKK